jgi:ribosomal protein S12 methylthiotransferase accessory factor YcaO
VALWKALAEAIQGRATYIAGAREDLMPCYDAAPEGVPYPFGLPLPASMEGVQFGEIDPGPRSIAGALADAGFPQIALVPLADLDGLSVVRAFVYGLGSMTRRRRKR